MAFSDNERADMLAIHGVGETVIKRLEEIGFSSLSELSDQDVEAITKQISEMMRSSCWHNSPYAKHAIAGVIHLAKLKLQ